MKTPAPLPCPICGRKPKCRAFVIECAQFLDHRLHMDSDRNLHPVRRWNTMVRRIIARCKAMP